MSLLARLTLAATAVVLALAIPLALRARAAGPPRPNIILVCVDGCSPDHLGLYGYARPTSPNIDRLGRQGAVFEHNIAQANESLFSHASMFTSLYASEMGPIDYSRFVLPAEVPTLARILASNGYHTGAFTGGGHVMHQYGFDQGFEVYWDKKFFGTFFDSVPQALDWMGTHRDAPQFVFLHGYDCHRPYRKTAPFDHMYDPQYMGDADVYLRTNRVLDRVWNRKFYPNFPMHSTWTRMGARPIDPQVYLDLAAQTASGKLEGDPLSEADVRHIVSHYDGSITYADTWLGAFFAHLPSLGLDPSNTLVVLVADHGEDLMQHGSFNHRVGLQESNVRVPLVFWGAGLDRRAQGARFDLVTENVDIVPTLLSMLDIAPPLGLRGRDLSPLLDGRVTAASIPPEMASRAAYSEGILGMISLVDGRRHLIVNGARPATDPMLERLQDEARQRAHFEYYDVAGDPQEVHNLAQDAAHSAEVTSLARRLYALEKELAASAERRPSAQRSAVPIDPSLQEKLRKHGYW